MRKYLSVVITFAFLVGVVGLFLTYRAQAQVAATTPRTLSRSALVEYGNLVKANAGLEAVRTWAAKYDLRVLSLRRGVLEVTSDPPEPLGPEITAKDCDRTKCGHKSTYETLTNTQGVITGYKTTQCGPQHAVSCSFVADPNKPGSWLRICQYRNCEVRIDSAGEPLGK